MPITIKITGIGVLFILMITSGFWLSKKNKPYPVILFNIHKIISLACFILGSIVIYNLQKEIELSSILFILILVTGSLFVLSMITGGLLNLDKPFYNFLKLLHRIFSLTVIILTAAIFYLTKENGTF